MAVLVCKMCGGDLIVNENTFVAECEHCGRKQTIPSIDDEKKLMMFERATRRFVDKEFDYAISLYERIVVEFPEEAEAYWGLVLCRYGIEYVDDPASGKKVPTCHRTSFKSVMDDPDYEQACKKADPAACSLYKEEAGEIEEIRKGIIDVSGKLEPYDIFISYKDKDERGERTIDSVIAQEVYEALTEKGYRVFFSRITFEDKTGIKYEPYIFAALNSAKIMLVFGTTVENLDAVWVKNEWSRFLKLMASDKSKHMYPCYKDLDPKEFPKEFEGLQAQDMGRIGAMQDLLHGIEKVLPRGGAKTQPQGSAAPNTNVETQLKRGMMALEDREWDKARKFFDKVLDMDAECAEAYLGLAMAEAKCHDREVYAGKYVSRGSKMNESRNAVRARKFSPDLEKWFAEMDKNLFNETKNRLEAIRKKLVPLDSFLSVKSFLTCGCRYDGTVFAVKKYENYKCNVEGWREIVAVSAGQDHIVGLKSNGTVLATGENSFGECNVEDWKDIVAVSAEGLHTLGLKADGTMVCAGNSLSKFNLYLAGWRDVVAVSAGDDHIVGLKTDGTVLAIGNNVDGRCNVEGWRDIVAVSAGHDHTVGLKADGTVVAAGNNEYNQCGVAGWSDIVAISAGWKNTVGLTANGTVIKAEFSGIFSYDSEGRKIVAVSTGAGHMVCVEDNGRVICNGVNHYGECGVQDWREIAAVSAGIDHTVGLKRDGTVITAGRNEYGKCNVEEWKDIVAVSAGHDHTVGLKADGTVIAVGVNDSRCNVEGWKDIVAVSAGRWYTAGLKSDGTVLVTTASIGGETCWKGWNDIVAFADRGDGHVVGLQADGTVMATGENDDGQCNVEDWKDIAGVFAGQHSTVGLKADGTVIATGANEEGQCNVTDWNEIVSVACGDHHTVGLKADGTVVATGNNEYGQCDVADWKDIVAIAAGSWHTVGLKADGTVVATGYDDGQCDVGAWKDIVASIAALNPHIFGLKADDATGANEEGQCDVGAWKDIVAIAALNTHTLGLKADGTVAAVGTTIGEFSVKETLDGLKLFGDMDKMVSMKEEAAARTKRLREEAIARHEREREENEARVKQFRARKEEISKRRQAEEEARIERERAEAQARAEKEQAENEARERAWLERNKRIDALQAERRQLEAELSKLRGLFVDKKRRALEARIKAIDEEIRRL